MAQIHLHIDEIARLSGIKPSVTSYVKHAALDNRRLRRIEAGLRQLLVDLNKAQDSGDLDSDVATSVSLILETAG